MAASNGPVKQPYQESKKPLLEKLTTVPFVGNIIEKQRYEQTQNFTERKTLHPSRRTPQTVSKVTNSITGNNTVNVKGLQSVIDVDDDFQKRSIKRRHQSEVTPGFDTEGGSKRLRENVSGPNAARALRYHSTSSYDKYLPERPLFTLQTLTQELMDNCKNSVQTFGILEKKMRLRFALETLIKTNIPGSSLHLVGSSCNGFGSNTSDADFCLLLTQMRKIDQRFEARQILLRIHKLLQLSAFVKDSQVIFATVPIIKFKDVISQCECDININNIVGIRNTHLLRIYCGIDHRVQPLVMVIKKWANRRNINDASNGTLSSYALVLMVLHYLQDGCFPAVLPAVQMEHPAIFRENNDVTTLLCQDPFENIPCHRSKNTQSVGELLLGFFRYFVEQFIWSEYFISVRRGKKFPRGADYKWRNKYICIEEPFDSKSVARAVYNKENFEKIVTQFKVAWNTLKVSPSLNSIL